MMRRQVLTALRKEERPAWLLQDERDYCLYSAKLGLPWWLRW